MVNAEDNYNKLLQLLDSSKVEYKLFEHKPAYTYEELAKVQKITGFFGTEGKNLVLKIDDGFIVYSTLQGTRVNFDAVKNTLNSKKVRLSTPEELKEYFGAEPGCAYPFGFDSNVRIFVDPRIYSQEWLLFSPVFPNKTIQARGKDLKNVFSALNNEVKEVTNFNQ